MEIRLLGLLPQSTSVFEPQISWFVEAFADATPEQKMGRVEYVIKRVRIAEVHAQHVRYGSNGTVSTYLHHEDPATVEARKRTLNWIIGQFADRQRAEWLRILTDLAQGQAPSQFEAAEKATRATEEKSRLSQHEAVAA